jgi:hypothetical protein
MVFACRADQIQTQDLMAKTPNFLQHGWIML